MSIPLSLTVFRLFLSVTLIPFLIFFLLPVATDAVCIFLGISIALVSFTDFLDGYYARRLQQETELGKVLDPLADKCLLLGVLVPLAVLQKIYFYSVIILLSREFIVLGLRQIAMIYHFTVPVSWWGKLKAFFQYCYMIIAVSAPLSLTIFKIPHLDVWLHVLMVFFSVLSGLLYFKSFFKAWKIQRNDVKEE